MGIFLTLDGRFLEGFLALACPFKKEVDSKSQYVSENPILGPKNARGPAGLRRRPCEARKNCVFQTPGNAILH